MVGLADAGFLGFPSSAGVNGGFLLLTQFFFASICLICHVTKVDFLLDFLCESQRCASGALYRHGSHIGGGDGTGVVLPQVGPGWSSD